MKQCLAGSTSYSNICEEGRVVRGSERSQESRSREEKGNSFRFLSFAIPPFSFHFPPLLQNLMGGSKEGKVTWLSSPTGSAFISFTLSLTLKTRSIRPAANNFFLIYFWNKFLGNVLLHLYFLFIFSHRNLEEVLSSRSYSGIQSCISWCYLKQPIIKFC